MHRQFLYDMTNQMMDNGNRIIYNDPDSVFVFDHFGFMTSSVDIIMARLQQRELHFNVVIKKY